mgnify:CR=1 FL=1
MTYSVHDFQRWGSEGGRDEKRLAYLRSIKEATRARYERAARAGLTRPQAAAHLGVSLSAVKHAAWRYGLKFSGGRK